MWYAGWVGLTHIGCGLKLLDSFLKWVGLQLVGILTLPNPKDDDDYYEGTEMKRKIDEGRTLAVCVQLYGVSLLSCASV